MVITKKKYKAYIAVLLTFILFICSGCSTKKTTVVSENTVDTSFLQSTLKKEVLNFYFPGSEPQGSRKVLDEIEKRLKSTLNVKLNFKWIEKDSYLKQLKYELDENNSLDVFIAPKEDMLELFKSGNVADITPYLQKCAPKLYQSYSKGDLANVTVNGRIIALPQCTSSSSRICAVVREDVLRNYNIKDIKTYEDLEDLMSLVKGDGYGPVVIQKSALDLFAPFHGYVPFTDNFVYKYDDPNAQLIPWEQTPDFKDSLQILERWKSNGYIFNYDQGDISKSLFEGYAALQYMTDRESIASVLTDWDDVQDFLYFKGIQEPKVRVFPLYPETTVMKPTNIATIGINKQAKDPERILKFLEWIESSQDNYDLFMYGIKGKNYELKDSKIDFPPTVQKYYGWDGSEVFFNMHYFHPFISNNDTPKQDEKAVYSPFVGFKVDPSAVQGFLKGREELYGKLQVHIENEEINVDEDIPSFIKDQQSTGVERITEDFQRQLDKWRTAN